VARLAARTPAEPRAFATCREMPRAYIDRLQEVTELPIRSSRWGPLARIVVSRDDSLAAALSSSAGIEWF
jgi:hypothetical protein